jgi:hypothetical protein
MTPARRQSLAYTKTVSIPVRRNAHQTQFPETPCWRTMSVTRFGVSVENVVATMEMPSSHHGMARPDRKYWPVSRPARRLAHTPMARASAK